MQKPELNIYFVAGTLHRKTELQERIESMMYSGVWSAESIEQAHEYFREAMREQHSDFYIFEIQDHELKVAWIKSAMPHILREGL